MKTQNKISKILWIELIGFDNTKSDFGVSSFLENAGFCPKIVSLFLWTSEFIHSYVKSNPDNFLGAEMCSYGARPENEERKRQNWTKSQLKGLIATLQSKGVKVYFCIFDHVMPDNWYQRNQLPKPERWIDSHPELIYITADNSSADYLCPLKRLSDGSFYEDFFMQKLEEVLNDYNFDGLHAGDGYAHPRYSVWTADFSDDMTEQFSETMKIQIPAGSIQERANWILANKQFEWTMFLSRRHLQFWEKTIATLRKYKCNLIFNTAWTRDPFEAFYRYGVDYRGLLKLGVKHFLVEAPAAVVEMEGWNYSNVHALDKFKAAFLMLKAYNPEADFSFINHIKDGNEGYNVLRHAPSRMVSDIYGMTELFYLDKSAFTRCASGLAVCLADGIRKEEWQNLNKYWDSAFYGNPKAETVVTLVWSDTAFNNEIKDYYREKYASSFELLCSLISSGLPVNAITNINNVSKTNCPLLVLNPGAWPAEELEKIDGIVYLVGLSKKKKFICAKGCGNSLKIFRSISPAAKKNQPEPASWLEGLPCILPQIDFFTFVTSLIQKENALIIPCNGTQIPYSYFKLGNGSLHVFFRNEYPEYKHITFCIKGNFSTIINITDINNPFKTNRTKKGQEIEFDLKIPPLTTAVLKVY